MPVLGNNDLEIKISAVDNASKDLTTIRDKVSQLGTAGEKAAGGIDKNTTSFKAFTAAMAVGSAIANVATSVISKGFSAITSTLDDAIKRVDTLNNFPKIMANFGVSTQASSQMIKQLDQGVRGLPTSLDSITRLAEGFVPVTKSVEEATKTALAFNNAVLAGGAPMDLQSAALEQFRQALSKGTPDLQDWKSIEMAMPAQLRQIATALGLGSGQLKGYAANGLGLYQSMKDGKLTMEDFNQALIKLNQEGINGLPSFAAQAKNATQGIQTGMANARTAVTRGMADIIQAIGSANISTAISRFGSGMEGLLKTTAALIPVAGDMAKKFGEVLTPNVSGLWDAIANKLAPALGNFWHQIIEPLLPVLGVTFVGALKLVIDTLSTLVSLFAGFVGWVTDNRDFLAPVLGALAGLKTALMLNDAFGAATVAFKTFQLVTIPQAAAEYGWFAGILNTPLVMPAIVIAAALASIAAVWDAYNKMQAAIQNLKDEQASAAKMQAQTQLGLIKTYNSSIDPAQKARIKSLLHSWGTPGFATGTNYAPGGLAVVGENGPELVDLPRGSKVYTNQQSQQMAANAGGRQGPVVNIEKYIVNNNVDNQQAWAEVGFRLRTA